MGEPTREHPARRMVEAKAEAGVIVLQVSMLTGRTTEQKAELISRLSEEAARHLGYPLDEVRVLIYEIAADDWGIGGRSVEERKQDAGNAG